MLDLPEDVKIFGVSQNIPVDAQLVRLTRELAAKKIDGSWWNIAVSKRLREQEDDNHWLWRKIVGEYHNHRAWEAVAIQTSGGDLEGAMIYRIDAKSQIDQKKGAVYIERIAAAPRNRPWLVNPHLYRGVGTVLLISAVRHSYLLGLAGRVWLTSLPSEKTRQFYARKGFEVIVQRDHGMIDYELPAEKAEHWLKEEGYL